MAAVLHLDSGHIALLVAVAGKVFIMAARTMPPPPAACGFWCRWFHDFIQAAASNPDKVGQTRIEVQK